MKTLQEKYNAVLEGSFPKSQFVRDAKMEVPRFISPYNGFEDTVQILKNKGMLVEAKAKTPEYDKPAPGYPLEALERGVDYELEKAGVDTATETATEGQYENAKKKAEKNLDKDPNFYLHLLSGDSKKVDKHDREVEVDQKKLFKGTVDPKGGKAEGNTDTFNAMKKATLREAAMAKGYTKEQVETAIKRLQEKKEKKINEDFAPSPNSDLMDANAEEYDIATAFKKAKVDMSKPVTILHAYGSAAFGGDDSKEMSAEAAIKMLEAERQERRKTYTDDGKEVPSDWHSYEFENSSVLEEDMPEGHEYKFAYFQTGDADYVITQEKSGVSEKKEKIDEGDPIVDEHEFDFFKEILDGRYKDEDIEEYLKSDDYQQALETLNLDASDTEEWIGEFANFFGDGADAYIDEGNIKEAVKKVIKHVLKENHQSLDLEVARRIEGLLDQALKAKFLEAGKDLIEDLVKEDQFAKNDVVSHLANELNLHVPIRDLFKEGTLNERVGGLQEFINLIQDRAVDSEFSEEEEALEVIEAIADHYGIKIQIGGFVGENVNENQDAIKFAQFIHAHGLKDKQIKDEEYLKDLYDNYKESVKENTNEMAAGDLELKSLAKKLIPIIKKYKMPVEYVTSDVEFKAKPKDSNMTAPARLLIKDGILTLAVYFLSLARSLNELDLGRGPSEEDYKKAKTQAGKMYKDITAVIGNEFELRAPKETNDYGYYIIQVRKK